MGRAAPRLSICIPTHQGRAATLEQAIESVSAQTEGDEAELVEICISDNASTDGTSELLDRLKARSEISIRYRRNDTDLGAARNALLAVDMARGDYCWILSSDDLLAEGAVRRVIELLDQHDGIVALTVDQVVFNPDASEFPRGWHDNRPTEGGTRVLAGTQRIVEELGLLFAGISLHVFQRAAWERVAGQRRDHVLGGHGMFPHAVILTQLAQDSPRWLWCSEPLIRYRVDPDAPKAVDLTTWGTRWVDDLSRALAPGLDEAAFRRVTYRYARHLCNPAWILAVRQLPAAGLRKDLFMARVLFHRLRWVDGFWSETMPALLMPRFAARLPLQVARAARIGMRAYRWLVGRSPLKARLTADAPDQMTADTIAHLPVRIENRGFPLRTWWPWLPVYVGCRWQRNGLDLDNRALMPARISRVIRRGRHREVSVSTPTPPQPGRYELSISLMWSDIWLEDLSWTGVVDVQAPSTRLHREVAQT